MKELNIKSRLHNEADVLEVDDKSLSEAVIPFIEADKDIISKLEYQETNITNFPKNVLPLFISTEDDKLYFDYQNGFLNDEDGISIADIGVHNDGRVFIEGYNETIVPTYIEYINRTGSEMISELNAYYLYHPVTETGTKLYRHILVLSGFDDEQNPTSCKMKLYTTNKTSIAGSYTSANDVAVALSGISLYYFDGEVSYELTSAIANSLSNEVGLINVTGSAPSFLLSSNYPLTITDTVTPL